jgi:phage-related minor tail protein
VLYLADGRVEYEIRGDDSKLDNDLDRAHGKVKKSGGKLGSIAKGTAVAIGSAFVAVGVAAVGVGVAAVKSANDMDKAMNGFISSTGKGAEEADKYQGILEDIYKNNYGESFEDIADKMALVNQQMGDLDDKELQNVVEKAYLLSDTFDIDIQESIRGANAMMNQFGVDSETAYNMMAQGAQAGLNQNGDLADQIAEYSTYYAQMGLSVEDMMNAMANGVESGAYQVDYLNDAMKEFGIRSKDGSNTSREAFEALGFNADDLFKKFANGGKDSKEAFKLVSEELMGMDDKVQQDAIGVALFGTKWEDTGVAAITALTDMNGEIDGTKDKLGEMEEIKYDSLGEMFEGLKRSVEILIIPLGEMLIPLLGQMIETILPIIEEVLPQLIEMFGGLFESILPVIEELLPVLIQMFQDLLPQIIPLIETILPVLVELFTKLAPPLLEIIKKLVPVLISLIDALLPIFMDLIDLLMPIIDLFIELLDPIIDLINSAIKPLIKALMPLIKIYLKMLGTELKVVLSVFKEVFKGIAGYVTSQVKVITNILKNLIGFIKNVFTGNWKGAWNNVKSIFSSIFKGIGNAFKFPLNLIIDGINGFTKGLSKIKIPKWVPGVGGKGFSIPSIPRLKVGMDYVPNDDFPALLHRGESVLTKEEAEIYRGLGGNLQGLLNAPKQSNTPSIMQGQSISKTDMKMAFKEAIKESDLGNAVLQVGYEELAKAVNKGQLIIDTRYGK